MKRNTRRLTAMALAGVAVAASGCSVANSGGGGYDLNTLRIVLPQEPPTLEPCESSLTSTGVVVRSNITEPLVERNPTTGDLEPLLATDWEQSGPTEWTFTLRDGVTFSDGAPFTAEDAAFSIDRAVNSDLQCNVDGYVFGDEVLTPDSSRFWPADSYEPGRVQFSFDKQYVRDWSAGLDWDRTAPGPEVPDEVVKVVHDRYAEVYRRITGTPWVSPTA